MWKNRILTLRRTYLRRTRPRHTGDAHPPNRQSAPLRIGALGLASQSPRASCWREGACASDFSSPNQRAKCVATRLLSFLGERCVRVLSIGAVRLSSHQHSGAASHSSRSFVHLAAPQTDGSHNASLRIASAIYDAAARADAAVVDSGSTSSVIASSERSRRRSRSIPGATIAALGYDSTSSSFSPNKALRHVVRRAETPDVSDSLRSVDARFPFEVAENVAEGGRIVGAFMLLTATVLPARTASTRPWTHAAGILVGGTEEHGAMQALEAIRRGIPLLICADIGGVARDVSDEISLSREGAQRAPPHHRSATVSAVASSKCARVLPEEMTTAEIASCLHIALTIDLF